MVNIPNESFSSIGTTINSTLAIDSLVSFSRKFTCTTAIVISNHLVKESNSKSSSTITSILSNYSCMLIMK